MTGSPVRMALGGNCLNFGDPISTSLESAA